MTKQASLFPKGKLQNTAPQLPPIPAKKREIISSGAQSLVLAESHKEVLLVTTRKTAENIALLSNRVKSALIDVPVHVGDNVSLVTLLTGVASPDKKLIQATRKKHNLPASLLHKNVVFKMPRYDGSLEMLKTIRFKEDSIRNLKKTLTNTIKLLHNKHLTHNDIVLRNVLYKGEFPNISFRLCDWGSLTASCPIKDSKKFQDDLNKINRIVTKAQEILESKTAFKKQAQKNSTISANDAKKALALGMSPLKPETTKTIPGMPRKVKNLLNKFNEVADKQQSVDTLLSLEMKPGLVFSLNTQHTKPVQALSQHEAKISSQFRNIMKK